MDIKVVVSNGVGYIRYPIPPGTYQMDLVKVNGAKTEINNLPRIGTVSNQITINPEEPVYKFCVNAARKANVLLHCAANGETKQNKLKCSGISPSASMTNLLFLALCCCEANSSDSQCSSLKECNYFNSMYPYLQNLYQQYRGVNPYEYRMNNWSVADDNAYYQIHLADYYSSDTPIEHAVLIIRNVPVQ